MKPIVPSIYDMDFKQLNTNDILKNRVIQMNGF